jgi:Fe(3+) dicitrate transport protein
MRTSLITFVFLLFQFNSQLFATNKLDTLENYQLKEVEIRNSKSFSKNLFDTISNENINITGKNFSVIQLSKINANLNGNYTRNVFAQTPGIHLWENQTNNVQVSIGTRGLSPNRSWEFNVRQNGYDISSDPFGYPEAYYTPPLETVEKIEIVKSSSSLQYGPQFGGLINFVMKSPSTKKIHVISKSTVSSYDNYGFFNSISGTIKKFSYLVSYQDRRGRNKRPNNNFNSNFLFSKIAYSFSPKSILSFDYTYFNQIAKQAGGLTDSVFLNNPLTSTRGRNWFSTPWQIASLKWKQSFANSELTLQLNGMKAERNSVGFIDKATISDNPKNGQYSPRVVDRDFYENYSAEIRYSKTYTFLKNKSTFYTGYKFFNGNTLRYLKGLGNRGTGFDLEINNTYNNGYAFKTQNSALYAEQLYNKADNIIASEILNQTKAIQNTNTRNYSLFATSLNYKINSDNHLFLNFSQAYRPVLFGDLIPSTTIDSIDQNLKEANGHTIELNYKSKVNSYLKFELSAYYLNYNNRIGTLLITEGNKQIRMKTNIGNSVTKGADLYAELNLGELISTKNELTFQVYTSTSILNAQYKSFTIIVNKKNESLQNKRVENAPNFISRNGINIGYKKLMFTGSTNFVSATYSDANNTKKASADGQVGEIPKYCVADASILYSINKYFELQAGCNNIFNKNYFTRRAGGYPGPGVLPADVRTFFLSITVGI